MTAPLLGRDAEVAATDDLLTTGRLVEIVGPGGIGKTALAISTARRLLDAPSRRFTGIWLARLETAVTATDVVDTVIAALSITSGEAALLERLRSGTNLLVLDNCEHVVDAAAEFAVRLLDAAPSLRILCTTQIPLDVDGEVVFELAPLALDDAVELFTQRARGQRTVGGASEVGDAIRQLCDSLDGLPLAIELAAARTKTLSVDEIIRRLDDRFNVLNDPTSRRPERRRALRATIRWSYDLLFPDDQRGLWALATFAGGASLDAVESVLDALGVPAPTAIDVVGRLAGRSLVIVDEPTAASPTIRYRLLDSIRAYALEAMAAAGATDTALAAHAAWFVDAAARSTEGVRGSDQAVHLAVARTERANIDAALAWTAANEPLAALGLANGFGWAWVVLGDSRGAQRLLAALAAAGELAPPAERATALLYVGWIEASTGRLELAHEHVAAAAEIADAIGDVELQARCCYYLAYVVSHDGDFARGLLLTDRSRELLDTLDRPWDQVANGLFATRAAISSGDAVRATELAELLDGWFEIVADPWMAVRREAMLGELARLERRFDDAVAHIARAAATSNRLGFLQTEAYQVASLGRAQCQAGDHAAGAMTLARAIDKAEATGDVRMAALARVHHGRVLRAIGDDSGARVALEAACAWHRSAGGGEQAPLGECLLAAMDAAVGHPGAPARLEVILDQARVEGTAHVEVFALDALARLAAQRGDRSSADALLAQADERMGATSHFISEHDRIDARAIRGDLLGR